MRIEENFIAVEYRNPDASSPMILEMELIPNTPDEIMDRNIRDSSRQYSNWLQYQEPHNRSAVLIGGGASSEDFIEKIKELQNSGATVFALNNASNWAREKGITIDHQVMIDAQEETSTLVDVEAKSHLFASRCNMMTLDKATNLTLFHLDDGRVERLLSKERIKRGGYVLIGGDTCVGTSALCVAFSQGYRDLHVFGYDSSHREGRAHAYKQVMNTNMPSREVTAYGRTFVSSIAMSLQPRAFMGFSEELKKAGCTFHVYGDGLLQTIYNEESGE